MIDLLRTQPALYFTIVICVVISVVLHELGHGFAALSQGDDTPRVTGHMTLNPLVHMGLFGLALLFLAGIAFGVMPVNPSRFRSRYGRALVAFAGPAVNLTLFLIAVVILGLLVRGGAAPDSRHPLYIMAYLNLVLFVFNLLPVPPLDGSTVLADFAPGYRRLISNPDNQPFFLGAFVLVFFLSGDIFGVAREAATAAVRVVGGL